MLFIKKINVGGIGEVNLKSPSAVSVVNETLVIARLEVLVTPGTAPPTSGDTNLRIGCFHGQVECLALKPIPNILRELGNTLIVSVMAFKGEAICATPRNSRADFIGPDNLLNYLPVTTVGGGFEGDGGDGQQPGLAVIGINLTLDHCILFSELLGQGDGCRAGSLAIEIGILDQGKRAVILGKEQLYGGDEFQVRTVDGQLLATVDFLAFLLGVTGNFSITDSQFQLRLSLISCRADFDLSGCNILRDSNPDHVVRNNLEIGYRYVFREYYFSKVRVTGTVDGHLQSGNHL